MLHTHLVVDPDRHFIIDPTTRSIENESGGALILMQYDHNSEVVTFDIPRMIEGHDTLQCDEIQIHFTNTGSGTSASNRKSNSDVYIMTDISEVDGDPETLVGTWLISQNATMYAGEVGFLLKFVCYDADRNPTYIWHTDVCKLIKVSPGFNNAESIINTYPDAVAVLTKLVDDHQTEMTRLVNEHEAQMNEVLERINELMETLVNGGE